MGALLRRRRPQQTRRLISRSPGLDGAALAERFPRAATPIVADERSGEAPPAARGATSCDDEKAGHETWGSAAPSATDAGITQLDCTSDRRDAAAGRGS